MRRDTPPITIGGTGRYTDPASTTLNTRNGLEKAEKPETPTAFTPSGLFRQFPAFSFFTSVGASPSESHAAVEATGPSRFSAAGVYPSGRPNMGFCVWRCEIVLPSDGTAVQPIACAPSDDFSLVVCSRHSCCSHCSRAAIQSRPRRWWRRSCRTPARLSNPRRS